MSDNGVIITDNFVKAEIFNNIFVSQTILDDSSTQPPTEPPNTFSSLKIDQLVVQPEVIYKIVSQLNISKATGLMVLAILRREAVVPLAEQLSNLFDYCISLEHFPELGKLLMFCLCIKKMILCYLTIIVQFHYYPSSQRFLKEFYLITFLVI